MYHYSRLPVAALVVVLMVWAVGSTPVSAQQAPLRQWPSNFTGYLVYVDTSNASGAATDAKIEMSLTFFAPGSHQYYWLLDNPDQVDRQGQYTDIYLFAEQENYLPVAE